MSSGGYEHQVVLVTGASSGLGREIAREIAGRGGHVILAARRAEELANLAREIAGAGGAATPLPVDLTDESSVKALMVAVESQFGRLHVLINNAGKELVLPLQASRRPVVRELFELNVVALADVTRQALRLFKGPGSIVNVASVVGLRGAAGLSLYGASKGAVVALTKSLARELAPRKLRVNAVAPGVVRTEMTERMFHRLGPDYVAELEGAHPLGLGSPREVARGVAFLAGSDASWITGHTLVIDGGYSI